MDCQEAVYSNDYYDIIGAITANVAGMEHVCRQDLAYRYAVFYLSIPEYRWQHKDCRHLGSE